MSVQQSSTLQEEKKMVAWSIQSYGDVEKLQLIELGIPTICAPDEVLVKVKAASLNPIDSLMLGGYGRSTIKLLRKCKNEFPLTLGRDFSGTIIEKGRGVNEEFNIGDEVYGFIPVQKQGTFAEVVLASKDHILHKPKHLTHEESVSLVFATMTTWGALFSNENLIVPGKQNKGLRILVLGGSGGVGTAAIQLLKSQGCVVVTTCSNDAIPLVTSLGADVVYDRNDPDLVQKVQLEGKYDIILDGINMGFQNLPNDWQYDTYVGLNSPFLLNNDKYGLFGGSITSAYGVLKNCFKKICSGKTVKWGFFSTSNSGFKFVHNLICQEKIRPVIHQKFSFKDLPGAMEALNKGHLRGKIVVSHHGQNLGE